LGEGEREGKLSQKKKTGKRFPPGKEGKERGLFTISGKGSGVKKNPTFS